MPTNGLRLQDIEKFTKAESNFYSGTKFRDIKRVAELFDFPIHLALNCRRKYLDHVISEYREYGKRVGLGTEFVCKVMVDIVREEIKALDKDFKSYLSFSKIRKFEDITDEMIQEARDYPVNSLINFGNGNARCINPDHTDNKPSMYLSSKINKATCGSCNWRGDAIDIVMILDGITFRNAVRKLCQMV